ncbi:MAG: LysM peptidoglycan-binding domain-containing protein [Gracilibacteraceae bacterium]|nr:LysM peptidoglycan-binding domain-containing protein [Gracilibacteraceae bacterium]
MFGTESRKSASRGIIVLIFLSLVFCAFPAFAAEVSEIGEAEYVVRAGDTLEGIARQYGVDVNELAALNGITNKSLINTGQTLKIPGLEPAPAAETTPGAPNASWDSSYISIDVREVDIRDVLSALAVSTGTNIVYKGGATQITLRMENVTPLAVLDYVTRIANLIYQRKDGMIIVASRGDMSNYFYEEEAITLFKLHYITGDQVAERMNDSLMPASVSMVYHEGGSRYLWVKGLPGELARVRAVLEVMDTSDNILGGSDAIPDYLRFIQLSYLNAAEFNTVLGSLGFQPGIAMQSDSMNLLYLGNDDDFAVIAKIQEIIDVKQSSTTVKRVIDFTTDPDEGYERLQIRRDLICEMTGISPSRFYISSNIAKSSGSTRYIMYLRGTPEEAAEVERVVAQIGE